MFTSSSIVRSGRYARIASLLVATFAACNRSDRTTTQETGDSMASATPPADSDAVGVTSGTLADVEVVQTLMTASSNDSAAGVLAEERGSAADVKQFGRDMQREHGALNEQLNRVATSLGASAAPVLVADSLRSEGTAALGRLRALDDVAFDSAYIAHAERAHASTLQLLNDRLLPQATNGELRTLLTQARDAVQAHLERARTLRAQPIPSNR